jgi:hypothetical protein
MALAQVIEPILPVFCQAHADVNVEISANRM